MPKWSWLEFLRHNKHTGPSWIWRWISFGLHRPWWRCYLQPNTNHTRCASFGEFGNRSLPCILFKGSCLLRVLSEWRDINTFWTVDWLLVNLRDDRESQIRSRLHQKIRPSVNHRLELGCSLLHFHHYCANFRSDKFEKLGWGGSRHACIHSNMQHFALIWPEDKQFMTCMDIHGTKAFISLLNV